MKIERTVDNKVLIDDYYLIVEGGSLSDEDLEKLRDSKVINLPDGVKVTTLPKHIDYVSMIQEQDSNMDTMKGILDSVNTIRLAAIIIMILALVRVFI